MRVREEIAGEVKKIAENENLGEDEVLGELLKKGLKVYKLEKAFAKYAKGSITLSQAADDSNVTLFEFEEFAIEKGFRHNKPKEALEEKVRKLQR